MKQSSRSLPICARNILAEFFPALDLDRARVHRALYCVDRLASINVGAFTLGYHLFFGDQQYDPFSATGIGLIGHELTHTEQYLRLGSFAFLAQYLKHYAANRLRGISSAEAYDNIPFEIAANAAQDTITKAISSKYGDNPCYGAK